LRRAARERGERLGNAGPYFAGSDAASRNTSGAFQLMAISLLA
jgi:hypothetical protein